MRRWNRTNFRRWSYERDLATPSRQRGNERWPKHFGRSAFGPTSNRDPGTALLVTKRQLLPVANEPSILKPATQDKPEIGSGDPQAALPVTKQPLLPVTMDSPVLKFATQIRREIDVERIEVDSVVGREIVPFTEQEWFAGADRLGFSPLIRWKHGLSQEEHHVGNETYPVKLGCSLGVCRLTSFSVLRQMGVGTVAQHFRDVIGCEPSIGLSEDILAAFARMGRHARPNDYGYIFITPAVHGLSQLPWLIRPTRGIHRQLSTMEAEMWGLERFRTDFEAGADTKLPFHLRRVFGELIDLTLLQSDPHAPARGVFSLAGIGLSHESDAEKLMYGGEFEAQKRAAVRATGSNQVTYLGQALVQVGRMNEDGSASMFDIFSSVSGERSFRTIDGYGTFDAFCNQRINAGVVKAVAEFSEFQKWWEIARRVRATGQRYSQSTQRQILVKCHDEEVLGAVDLEMPLRFEAEDPLELVAIDTRKAGRSDLDRVYVKLLRESRDLREDIFEQLKALGILQAEGFRLQELPNATGWSRAKIYRAFYRELVKQAGDRKVDQAIETLHALSLWEIGGTDADRELRDTYSPAAALENLRLILRQEPELVTKRTFHTEVKTRFTVFKPELKNARDAKARAEWDGFVKPMWDLAEVLKERHIRLIKGGRSGRMYHVSHLFGTRNLACLEDMLAGLKTKRAKPALVALARWEAAAREAIAERNTLRGRKPRSQHIVIPVDELSQTVMGWTAEHTHGKNGTVPREKETRPSVDRENPALALVERLEDKLNRPLPAFRAVVQGVAQSRPAPPEILELEAVLAHEQEEQVSDPDVFARLIERVLNQNNYCIAFPDGEIARRMYVNENGFLEWQCTSGSKRGFKSGNYKLAPYIRSYTRRSKEPTPA